LTHHPYGHEFELEVLPPNCEETKMGWFFGATRQWRGPNGLHIREKQGRLVAHIDREDPRHNLLGHLIADTPAELAYGVSAGAGLIAWLLGSMEHSLIWGASTAVLALALSLLARRRYE
jgi:hypothetical protein